MTLFSKRKPLFRCPPWRVCTFSRSSTINSHTINPLHLMQTTTHSNTQAILYLIALESLFSTRSPVCRSRRIRPFAVLLTSCSIVAPGVLGELLLFFRREARGEVVSEEGEGSGGRRARRRPSRSTSRCSPRSPSSPLSLVYWLLFHKSD